MSRGIVSQRPFSRKKHKQSFKKVLNRSGVSIPEIKISPKIKNILSRGMGFTLLIIIGTLILVKLLFFQPEQTISHVKFSDNTEATYKNTYLFDFIAEEVKGKNYFLLNSKKSELLSKIQNGFTVKSPSGETTKFKFPFVGDIELQLEETEYKITNEENPITIGVTFPIPQGTGEQFGIGRTNGIELIQTEFPLRHSQKNSDNGGTLGIQLMYYEPTILIKLNDKKYAVWDENTYVEMKEGMLLGIRTPTEDDPYPEQLFTIETPQYLTGTNSLEGFFFEISLPKMLKIVSLAKEEFGSNILRFVYLAGSTRFAIFTSDQKTLYFNFPDGGNIEEQRNSQIFKYNTLRERYENFGNINKIDLGALEKNKTIITNY